jgi:hypothetical protein
MRILASTVLECTARWPYTAANQLMNVLKPRQLMTISVTSAHWKVVLKLRASAACNNKAATCVPQQQLTSTYGCPTCRATSNTYCSATQ